MGEPRVIYGEDLAWIHNTGFSGYALGAAPGLLALLRRNGVKHGLVVDLGCGSGRWAAELNRNAYDVVGIDRSNALLKIARRTAPAARFVAGSLWVAPLPECDAVTSIGECMNYDAGRRSPARLFARVRGALRPGGVFIFDAAGPSRAPVDGPQRTWSEGEGWAVMLETRAEKRGRVLTRRIISYRKNGGAFRRSEELHRLRLFAPEDLLTALRDNGFRAECVGRFGKFQLPPGIRGFVAIRT
jgi:SAM-dependent methyltransferase